MKIVIAFISIFSMVLFFILLYYLFLVIKFFINKNRIIYKLKNTKFSFGDSNIKQSDEYLNTVLEDGKTIREHQEEDLKKQAYLSSNQAKIDFPKQINQQYKYVIEHMENRSKKYIDITKEEEIILKTFLEKVSHVRKKYSVNLIRYGHGMIRIHYNGCQVGQFNFRTQEYYIQVLRGATQNKDFENITFNECLEKVDAWVRYCKYQLKQTNFYGVRI